MSLMLKCLCPNFWINNCQPWTVTATSAHKDEVCNFDDNLTIFDSSSSNEEEADESSDSDDCCHHIEKVNTNIQIFSIFIISLIITN
jgi:hypothetical protein